jgi:SNF2 family DNA or RNA helicase
MSLITPSFPVNKKSATLCLNSTGAPVVTAEGLAVELPDVPWSRWYIKTHFEHLGGTPDAILWYKKHDPLAYAPIKNLLHEPRFYQILSLNRMKLSNCCLFHDMGLGKTFISIAFSLWLFEQGFGALFLIVCPPGVFVTWEDEIALHASGAKCVILHGSKKDKNLAALRTEKVTVPTFILTTYETLESVREKLQEMPIISMYFDESSKVKNYEAKRTQSVHALAQALHNARRFCLSGTPSTKDPLGLFSQFELLYKGASGHQSYTSFCARYAITKLFATVKLPHGKVTTLDAAPVAMQHWLWEHQPPGEMQSYGQLGFSFDQSAPKRIRVLGYHKRNIKFINQDELHAITQRNAYTLRKQEVLKDLPPKTRQRRSIELSPEQRKAYNEVLHTNKTELANTVFDFNNYTSPYAKLHQIANGYIINADKTVTFFSSQPKLQELLQIIEELGDQKIVIWSPFRPQIAKTVEFMREEGFKLVELHGGVSQNDRRDIIHEFQNSTDTHLIANPSVGGLGLNLQSACVEVFLSNWYSPDVRIQAEDRLWRSGQQNPVTVLDLVARATLETRILRTVLGEIKAENNRIAMSVLMGKEDE